MKKRVLFFISVSLFAAVSCSRDLPRMVSRAEMRALDDWTENHLTGKNALPPFSFVYGNIPSSEVLGRSTITAAETRLDADRTALSRIWTDGETGLQVRCEAVVYQDFPVVEWAVYLKNTGTEDTPAISDLKGMDILLPADDSFIPLLHGRHGDYEQAECYAPFIDTLSIGTEAVFSPPGSGKSTDGPRGWPYHNLQTGESNGFIVVLGWPGQWEDRFSRVAPVPGNAIRVSGGQQTFFSYLKPGEEIRTPLNLILFWKDKDTDASQNLWRRFYLAHIIPHFDGEPQQPAFEIQCSPAKGSIAYLQKYMDAGAKPDISWQDANWYPSAKGPYGPNGWRDKSFPYWLDPTKFDTWLNTGTWEIDSTRFPDGFKDFSKFANEQDIQFLVWFEPERVGDPTSWLGTNHPEWLLPNILGDILDEGKPEARMWLTDHIDRFIKENGLVWYREDMNGGGPGPAWRNNDGDGRIGITENHYVKGHLAYWDSLKARNPGLHIDACASGGRRNDLETMKRAVPLLRSDFQWNHMKNLLRGNQGHTYGLSSWFPFQGSAAYDTTMYAARSFYLPLFGTAGLTDGNKGYVKRVYDEHRAVAEEMLYGDFWPLTPYCIGPEAWIAWQFDRPETGTGVIQAFRREECDTSITLRLRGLDPRAEYFFYDFDEGIPGDDPGNGLRFKGKDLMGTGLTVTATENPQAKVFLYRKVK